MFAGVKDPFDEVAVGCLPDLEGVAAIFQASGIEGVVAVLEGAGVEGLALVVGQTPSHTFPSIALGVHHLKGEALVEAKDARRRHTHAHGGVVVAGVDVGASQIQNVVLHHAAFVGLLAERIPCGLRTEKVVGDDLGDTRLGFCQSVAFGGFGDKQGRGRTQHVGQMPLRFSVGLGRKGGPKDHENPSCKAEVQCHDEVGW